MPLCPTWNSNHWGVLSISGTALLTVNTKYYFIKCLTDYFNMSEMITTNWIDIGHLYQYINCFTGVSDCAWLDSDTILI